VLIYAIEDFKELQTGIEMAKDEINAKPKKKKMLWCK